MSNTNAGPGSFLLAPHTKGKEMNDRNRPDAAPPPSDAAPVAQLLYDTMPDMIIAVLIDNEIDPLKYAEKWAEVIGPLYAHPEDAPRGPWAAPTEAAHTKQEG